MSTTAWERAERTHFHIQGHFQPQGLLGRCTRFVVYEPGRNSFCHLREREEGRFSFKAETLAQLIEGTRGDTIESWPEEKALLRWLRRADTADHRFTRLPNDFLTMSRWIEHLVINDECRIYCRKCARMLEDPIRPDSFFSQETPYHFRSVRCPSGHVLIRLHIIRLIPSPIIVTSGAEPLPQEPAP